LPETNEEVSTGKHIASPEPAPVCPRDANIPEMETTPEHVPNAHSATSNDTFLQWFGNSKVRDEAGNPRVCFHGTSSCSKKFARTTKSVFAQLGSWFDDGMTAAQECLQGTLAPPSERPNLIPVYLCIENPKEFADVDELNAQAEGKFGPRTGCINGSASR
jgi:hypothetical protein